MVFSNFIRTVSGSQILLKNTTPIENVGSLKFYKDNSSGTFTKKEFRWSFNKNYWSSWVTLNQGNLTKIDVKGNSCLYIEVRYITANTSAKVTTFSINYTESTSSTTNTTQTVTTTTAQNSCNQTTCVEATTETEACTHTDSYYLWRPNHKGTQPISSITGLQQILNNLGGSITNGENVSGSGIGVFYQKLGQSLIFKKIDVSGGISISDSSGLITLIVNSDPSISELYSFYNSLESSLYDLSIYIDNKFIQIDSSLNYLYSSLVGDSSVKGAINIGDGSASIYAGITSDGSLLFREIIGDGTASISIVGDLVVVGLDASFSGGEVNTGSNIDGGDASIFSGKIIHDLQFKSIKSLETSILFITSDASYIYIDVSLNMGFDILDGGWNWTNIDPCNGIDGGSW